MLKRSRFFLFFILFVVFSCVLEVFVIHKEYATEDSDAKIVSLATQCFGLSDMVFSQKTPYIRHLSEATQMQSYPYMQRYIHTDTQDFIYKLGER